MTREELESRCRTVLSYNPDDVYARENSIGVLAGLLENLTDKVLHSEPAPADAPTPKPKTRGEEVAERCIRGVDRASAILLGNDPGLPVNVRLEPPETATEVAGHLRRFVADIIDSERADAHAQGFVEGHTAGINALAASYEVTRTDAAQAEREACVAELRKSADAFRPAANSYAEGRRDAYVDAANRFAARGEQQQETR